MKKVLLLLILPLSAAAAAAIALLAFLCRIPQALQSDLGPRGPLRHRGVLVVLQSEQTLIGILVFEEVVLLEFSVSSIGDVGSL